MDLVDCFAFAGGVEEGLPGCCVNFGEEGLEGFGGAWTRVKSCTGCDGGIPFGDS
jgi:hypothetical protein